MHYKQEIKLSTFNPIYSPRSNYHKYLEDIQNLKTNIVINIDKQTLSLFKNEFEENNNEMDLIQFISVARKNLKAWQKDLPERDTRLIKYLSCIFQEIQSKKDGKIQWEQFNNAIIEKALNLKSLQSQQSTMNTFLKPAQWNVGKTKFLTPIQKMISISKLGKLACLCEQSNCIQFFSLNSNQHNFKPLILQKQELIVEKNLNRRVKERTDSQFGLGVKENYKKQVIVADYKIIFLDMIYISNAKYEMLLTSSSDGMVRGWNVSGTSPALSKQPENQDEKMCHQFPVEIHCMAWDEINQILYCSGKNTKVYLWLVKTDSERELYDPTAHGDMISSMIMMPKLQFLATGGYDGKLVLWDTISLVKKFKYEEHTRSIVSMTFHEGLILLFTAAFDHSICVWNPYIPTLIYKISSNLNVVEVKIIPNTNYIASLDTGSNVRIREINKFNLISSYVVDRADEELSKMQAEEKEGKNKIQPTYMEILQNPCRFYFAGHSIKCADFDEFQSLKTSEYFPTHLKYIKEKMQLLVTIKNNIQVWDVLTGKMCDNLLRQTENEITAIDLIENSSFFIVGDIDGTVNLRKVQNGVRISKLFQNKSKSSVTHLLCKKGGLWNESVIIVACNDSDIYIFGKDQLNEYLHMRTLTPKKTHADLVIECLEYEGKRNILIIGSNTGDILFMDVDKNKLTNVFQSNSSEIQNICLKPTVPMVVAFNKKYQIFGVYLPPHSKKFKGACELQGQSKQRINVVIPSEKTNRYFIGCEDGTIERISIPEKDLHSSGFQLKKIYSEWSLTLSEGIKDMILIQNQTILVVIQNTKSLSFISALTGGLLNSLNPQGANFNYTSEPLCFFKQETKQIYDPKSQKYHSIPQLQNEKNSVHIYHNPCFLYDLYLQNIEKAERRSNTNWKVFPQFDQRVENNIQKILAIRKAAEEYESKPKKRKLRSDSQLVQSQVKKQEQYEKAKNIHSQWQKSKEEDDQMGMTKTRKLLSQSYYKTQMRKSTIREQKNEEEKKKSLFKNESSPMIRLGYALQRIDEKDKKAMKFIQMGQKKTQERSVKLPKLK